MVGLMMEATSMKQIVIYSAALALALTFPLSTTYAADQDRDQTQLQDQTRLKDRDGYPITGYDMMTDQERAQFQDQMRSMDSMAERQAYREQHHERMMERARAQGIDVENLPPTAAGLPDDKGMMDEDKMGPEGMGSGGMGGGSHGGGQGGSK